MNELRMVHAGFGRDAVPYEPAWDLQRTTHAAVLAGRQPDTVLLLEHPSVYTAGKRTHSFERPTDGTPVVDVDRGGKITWHGPGQLVGYPIVRLPDPIDVVAHVRRIEDVLISVCADLGLPTTRIEGRSGVWVPKERRDHERGTSERSSATRGAERRDHERGTNERSSATRGADDRGQDRKVAAVGIRVSHGVTMHGFALNCDCDLGWFDRIVPCGITDASVTSLTAELGRTVTVHDALPLVEAYLERSLRAQPRRPRATEPVAVSA